jgi:hypothetical protein
MRWSVLFQLVSAVLLVAAHPGEDEQPLAPAELARRQAAAAKRHVSARECGPAIARYHAARRAKRALAQKPLGEAPAGDASDALTPPTRVAGAHAPHHTVINNVCA